MIAVKPIAARSVQPTMPLDTDIHKHGGRKDDELNRGPDRASEERDGDLRYRAVLDDAVNGLARARPELSAKSLLWPWQATALTVCALGLLIAVAIRPQATAAFAFGLLALPFFCVVVLRVAAICRLVSGGAHIEERPAIADDNLPTYAVLVPLFREAQTVPGLIEALARIDYPQHLLEISLIVEEIDRDTRAALAAADLNAAMRVVVVPDGAPRTKPRALNFALATATGEIVVVFDAEDTPEPDQLRRAAAVFRSSSRAQNVQPDASLHQAPHGLAEWGPNENTRPLACVQARLNIYNRHDSWLARQFTLEYTALFDAILPALQRHDLPVPLGGTSNHFDRALLEKCGGWDPFNVTEDADLGIRFARLGARVEVLASTTWEEAPASFPTWIGQRTRWLKGWMQTYVVHMRQPGRLWRELGAWRFTGFQLLMGGMIASALVHPWFYLAIAADLIASPPPAPDPAPISTPLGIPPDTTLDVNTAQARVEPGGGGQTSSLLFWIGVINLLAGYLSAMALGALAVTRRGWASLGWQAVLMPVYWLLISLAAHRALIQLITAPHLWEKTDHRERSVRPQSPAPATPP